MTYQEVLKQCVLDGMNVKLPAFQLGRDLFHEVKEKLESAGGVWTGGNVQAFVFTIDPGDLIKQMADGAITSDSTETAAVASEDQSERHLLRTYNGYVLYDGGPYLQTGTNRLDIYEDADKPATHTLYYDRADPQAINKAIERAKEWINQNPSTKLLQYSDDDLLFFKGIIEKKLSGAEAELAYLQGLIEKKKNPAPAPADGEPVITEDIDLETEQIEQMATRLKTFIDHLKKALERIADKTYGVCRVTGKLIDKARLTAVPHATLSAEAKGLMVKLDTTVHKEEPTKQKRGLKKKDTGAVRSCRVCGCTEHDCRQCIAKTGEPCHWVEQDLCSACVVPQDPSEEIADNAINTPFNNNDMNFFQQLSALGKVDITMRVMEVNGKLTVGIMPKGKSTLLPINITGTASKLDEDFFTLIIPEIKDIPGLVTNIAEVKKAIAEKEDEEEDEETEDPEKKNQPLKRQTNSKAPVKKKKQTVKKKPATKKNHTPPKKSAPKKTAKKKNTPRFMALQTPSAELSVITGEKPMAKTDFVKKIWDYIKKNGLQDNKNKRMINSDQALKDVFGGKDQVSMFDMAKYLQKHLKPASAPDPKKAVKSKPAPKVKDTKETKEDPPAAEGTLDDNEVKEPSLFDTE